MWAPFLKAPPFLEHMFPDPSAFADACVQSTLGHARESSNESLPFFLLKKNPHAFSTTSSSLPNKSDSCILLWKAPLNTLASFWHHAFDRQAGSQQQLRYLQLLVLSSSTLEACWAKKLQDYHRLRSSKLELLQQPHFRSYWHKNM